MTLTAEQAVKVGLAEGLTSTAEEAVAKMGLMNPKFKTFEMNWAERAASFIVSPGVAALLTLIGLAGLFIEYKTPGFGLFGGIGLSCLALVFWGHSIAHLAGQEGAILFILGMILLGVEIFLIPGFGLFGAAGIALVIVGLLLTFLKIPVTDPLFIPKIHLVAPLTMVGTSIVGATILVVVALAYLPELRAMGRMGISLPLELTRESGYASFDAGRMEWIGRVGTAVSPLRPGGIASFDGERIDVVSEGEFVGMGAPVRVVGVEGIRIIVRAETVNA